MDVDTEVPAAKLMSAKEGGVDKADSQSGLAEAASTSWKSAGGDAEAAEDDEASGEREPRARTPEERVARVAVTNSEKFKRAALKAAKEAAISKRVANRATENAHAF